MLTVVGMISVTMVRGQLYQDHVGSYVMGMTVFWLENLVKSKIKQRDEVKSDVKRWKIGEVEFEKVGKVGVCTWYLGINRSSFPSYNVSCMN